MNLRAEKQCLETFVLPEHGFEYSLQKQLLEEFPQHISKDVKFGFYFPHRLDYATSGVMCVALTKKACAAAGQAFQNNTSQKYYLALVHGHISASQLEINFPIGEESNDTSVSKDCQQPQNKMCCDDKKGRPALTRLVILDRGLYCSEPSTKILLRPLTGRRHQLRVHCHQLGHTIIGDYTYSNGRDIDPPRMYLHSYRLVIPNDLSDLNFETEDPFDECQVEKWTSTERCCDIETGTRLLLDEQSWSTAVSCGS